MTTWLQSEMDTINGDTELLLDIHQDIVPPGNAIPDYESEAFDQPAPLKPERQRRPSRPVKPELEISFWDRLIPGRQQRLIQAQAQDLQQWESELEAWKHHCLQIDKAYEQRLQQYERQVAEWNRAWDAHQHEQTQLAQVFTERLTTDESLVVEILTAELNDLDWPRETLVDFDIDLASQSVYLDVDLPEIEDIPARSAEFGARNRRLLIKDKSDRQRREGIRPTYSRYHTETGVCGAGPVAGNRAGSDLGLLSVPGFRHRAYQRRLPALSGDRQTPFC